MLLATVSQAPYCRGGVRQAIGDRIATLFLGFVMLFDATSLRRIVHYLQISFGTSCDASTLRSAAWPLKLFCEHSLLNNIEQV